MGEFIIHLPLRGDLIGQPLLMLFRSPHNVHTLSCPQNQTVELKYAVSAPGLTAFAEETLNIKVLAENNKKPVLEVFFIERIYMEQCI